MIDVPARGRRRRHPHRPGLGRGPQTGGSSDRIALGQPGVRIDETIYDAATHGQIGGDPADRPQAGQSDDFTKTNDRVDGNRLRADTGSGPSAHHNGGLGADLGRTSVAGDHGRDIGERQVTQRSHSGGPVGQQTVAHGAGAERPAFDDSDLPRGGGEHQPHHDQTIRSEMDPQSIGLSSAVPHQRHEHNLVFGRMHGVIYGHMDALSGADTPPDRTDT